MKPDIIKIRVFGSKSCDECEKQVKAFDMHSIGYEFVDVDDTTKEKICDLYLVDRLPHTHAYSSSTGIVFVTSVGYVSPSVFITKIGLALSDVKTPVDLKINGVRQGPGGVIKPTIGNAGCKGCNDAKKTD